MVNEYEASLNTGELCIASVEGLYWIKIPLHGHNGLYYYSSDIFATDSTPYPSVCVLQCNFDFSPVSPALYNYQSEEDLDDMMMKHFQKFPTPKLQQHHTRPKPPKAPTTLPKQLEAELWLARLAFPSTWQMEEIPDNSLGLPTKFYPHPFSQSVQKTSAVIHKQPAGKDPLPVT